MEELRNTEQATQAENMGSEPEAQGAVKTFTQDEVNHIIQGRLDQMKKQAAKEQDEEISRKSQELASREMKLMVKEKLDVRNMPRQLADIITCADEKDLEIKLNALESIYGKKEEKPLGFTIKGGKPYEGNGRTSTGPDPIRGAMGLD